MSWDELDPSLRAVVAVLVLIQLTLMVTALVRLARTPEDEVAHLPRWAWLLIIVSGQLVGPVIFFAVGRSPQPVKGPAPAPRGEPMSRIVDVLYGDQPPSPGTRDGRP